MDKNFALMGAAGFVAERHMRAIRDNGCELKVAVDPHDSVGIMDSYFPKAAFFTEVERFDRHIYKLRDSNKKIDYFSICTPNYLHDAHIRLAMRNDANAICEKPLIISPKNIKYLKKMEDDTQKKIYCILQLRHHRKIKALKDAYKSTTKVVDIDLKYITSRGAWYEHSWKGDINKSGGLSCNIGIHFFDMLVWVFGEPEYNIVTENTDTTISGNLRLQKANINWYLSIDGDNLPKIALDNKKTAYRSMIIDGVEFEFSDGFKNLHTSIYTDILNGGGFGVDDTVASLYLSRDVSLGAGKYNY